MGQGRGPSLFGHENPMNASDRRKAHIVRPIAERRISPDGGTARGMARGIDQRVVHRHGELPGARPAPSRTAFRRRVRSAVKKQRPARVSRPAYLAGCMDKTPRACSLRKSGCKDRATGRRGRRGECGRHAIPSCRFCGAGPIGNRRIRERGPQESGYPSRSAPIESGAYMKKRSVRPGARHPIPGQARGAREGFTSICPRKTPFRSAARSERASGGVIPA